jgi:hypothetical protein
MTWWWKIGTKRGGDVSRKCCVHRTACHAFCVNEIGHERALLVAGECVLLLMEDTRTAPCRRFVERPRDGEALVTFWATAPDESRFSSLLRSNRITFASTFACCQSLFYTKPWVSHRGRSFFGFYYRRSEIAPRRI